MSQSSIKKNTIYNAIKTVSAIVFPLITFPYITRVLLPENTGKIDFGLSIVSYFNLIATLGINSYAIRECSVVRNDRKKLSNLASQIYSINILTTAAAYVLLAITLFSYHKLYDYKILIFVQSMSIVATTLGADWLNSAMEDFKYITIRTMAFQFVALVLMFAFVHKPEDYMRYVVISLVSSGGASVVNIWYRRKYCSIKMIWNIKNGIEWKRHFVPIIFMFVMILAQTVFGSVDSTMLGLMHGDREVGIYGAAHKIANIIMQLVASILWVVMPRMSSYFSEGDYEKINGLLSKVFSFNAFLGLPCAVGAFMLSDDIIMIAAGGEYADSSIVLKILMISFAFSLFGGSFLGNIVLLPSKREKTYMLICCFAAVVNIIMNGMLIPKFGVVAAASTTMFCSLLMLIILIFSVDKRIRIYNMFKMLVEPVIGCLAIVVICFMCRNIAYLFIRTAVCVCLSVLAYMLIMQLLKNQVYMELLQSIIGTIRNKIHRQN